ncbi:tripartite motif-containing protein 35 [Austrofundulus limnaeus]|uniref:Tripartite motif-containing protein 35 n=1 Tax=Austrofundulus limnaeus TaxID=52670 RepID=A0A2I4C303_AUSLI|nr:PREDICTED: tripartite motif-containing protein 35-like [Austrofundulus limnaeus]
MAANIPQAEEDCTCPVCCDLFTDPVVLLCGHSFCKNCLQEWWRQSRLRTCPVCKETFAMPQPPRNIALNNLSESLRQARTATGRPVQLCPLHSEELKLFCEDDKQPVCLVCRDAKTHKKHNCVPINEAAEEYRAQLQINLLNLKRLRGSYEMVKQNCDKMAAHIQLQAQQTEKKIRAEFQKFYKFLREDEAGRIDACRKEAKDKSEAMSLTTLNLAAEISELTQKIQKTEEEMRTGDLSFILNLKTTMKRSLCKLPEPKSPTGALMDEAKHIGNMQFSVLKKMSDIIQYTPVILDPNVGSRETVVSENLTSAANSDKALPFPDNPERLGASEILGYKGFNSGKHSWDVEVGGYWAVGVAAKTDNKVYRRIWAIYMCVCTDILRELTPEDYVKEVAQDSFPQKVRVQIDYDQGVLSFLDLVRNKSVHTIKHTFTETVFPYFNGNAKLVPAKVSVSVKQPKTS